MPVLSEILNKLTLEEILSSEVEMVLKGMTKSQFINLSSQYSQYRMERDKNGAITIITPVKGGSGFRENRLSYKVNVWQDGHKEGMVFSASTGFDLPDGSTKSPDIAWLSKEKIASLSPNEIENEYIPAVPDFVAEIKSKSDSLAKLKRKLKNTWIKNGVRLGWLIAPYGEKAYVYRADGTEETILGFDKKLFGEDVLDGFELPLNEFRLIGK